MSVSVLVCPAMPGSLPVLPAGPQPRADPLQSAALGPWSDPALVIQVRERERASQMGFSADEAFSIFPG